LVITDLGKGPRELRGAFGKENRALARWLPVFRDAKAVLEKGALRLGPAGEGS